MIKPKTDSDFEEINSLIERMREDVADPHKITFGLRVLQNFIADIEVSQQLDKPQSDTFKRVADICRP